MKDIEFRAWLEETQEMMYDFCSGLFHGGICDINAEIKECQKSLKLMQYTGLKDKNGVKVFEGDKVVLNHWKSTDLFDYGNPFIVKWEYGQINFKQGEYNNFIGSLLGKLDIEVIGNVYEVTK